MIATPEQYRTLADLIERERRIDEAVRLKLPTRQSLVYFERSATCDTAWAAFLAADILAEYRRIVEREEGRA